MWDWEDGSEKRYGDLLGEGGDGSFELFGYLIARFVYPFPNGKEDVGAAFRKVQTRQTVCL
jgi:hypothetical protein